MKSDKKQEDAISELVEMFLVMDAEDHQAEVFDKFKDIPGFAMDHSRNKNAQHAFFKSFLGDIRDGSLEQAELLEEERAKNPGETDFHYRYHAEADASVQMLELVEEAFSFSTYSTEKRAQFILAGLDKKIKAARDNVEPGKKILSKVLAKDTDAKGDNDDKLTT